MNFIIKKIDENQLKILSTIHKYKNLRAMIKENKALILDKSIEIFGVFDNDKLIGCIHIKYKSEDARFTNENIRAYLFGFRIDKNYQNQGIGKYLMSKILDYLKDKGFREVSIGVEKDNAIALKIYRFFGFDEKIATLSENYQGDEYEYDLYLKTIF